MNQGPGPLDIKTRLQELRQELPSSTQLLAVSKNRSLEVIQEAYQAGQRDFGENRVQELLEKSQALQDKQWSQIRWHFIGHLQTNKIKLLFKVPHLHAIHSVDSLKLLRALWKEQNLLSGEVNYFLQIHTSHEAEKSGLKGEEQVEEVVQEILAQPTSALRWVGLMTIGPIRTEAFLEEADRCFHELAQLKSHIEKKHRTPSLLLSMGMSQDYQVALKHGTHYVRIGSALFSS